MSIFHAKTCEGLRAGDKRCSTMKNKIYQIVAIMAIVVYALASCTPRENPDVSKNTQKMYDSIYVYNTNNGEDFILIGEIITNTIPKATK